jgi:hypothetical protein
MRKFKRTFLVTGILLADTNIDKTFLQKTTSIKYFLRIIATWPFAQRFTREYYAGELDIGLIILNKDEVFSGSHKRLDILHNWDT